MLRRAENVRIQFRYGLGFSTKGRVRLQIGLNFFTLGSMKERQFREIQLDQRSVPLQLLTIGERTYWYFEDRFYWEDEGLEADEVQALLLSEQQRKRGRIERAKAMAAMGFQAQDQSRRRDVIPDDVKQLVWLRDGGRCRHCGSQVELQYDHIIPVTLGGSSNPENLQILCGPCNRRKSAGLTVR